jgi:hypothetical protein
VTLRMERPSRLLITLFHYTPQANACRKHGALYGRVTALTVSANSGSRFHQWNSGMLVSSACTQHPSRYMFTPPRYSMTAINYDCQLPNQLAGNQRNSVSVSSSGW